MSIRRQLGDLAKSLDSSAVGSFLSKGASEADFTTISYSDVSGTPSVVADSAVATSIIDSAYVSARVITVAAGLDSATTINLLDSNYMAARSGGGAGFYVYNYDATAGQTTFQDSDASGNVMSYSADGIIVFYNGVMLPTADYTATDGTSVVLSSAAESQDVVTIAKWGLGATSSYTAGDHFGDRGLTAGGTEGSFVRNYIEYINITATGNATDFGDLTKTKRQFSAVSDVTYGVFGGEGGDNQTIDYVTIATTGNASDFGDAGAGRSGGVSDGNRGCFGGGYINSIGVTDAIEYITITTPSNTSSFGNLTTSRTELYGGMSDNTYGVFNNGNSSSRVLDYITIATTGNATDFGDISTSRTYPASADDASRGVTMGGNYTNVIDYITIATPGNATDFGDLVTLFDGGSATSNSTRAVACGGYYGGEIGTLNQIQYITIQTTGNASDFGDMVISAWRRASTSGSPS